MKGVITYCLYLAISTGMIMIFTGLGVAISSFIFLSWPSWFVVRAVIGVSIAFGFWTTTDYYIKEMKS